MALFIYLFIYWNLQFCSNLGYSISTKLFSLFSETVFGGPTLTLKITVALSLV